MCFRVGSFNIKPMGQHFEMGLLYITVKAECYHSLDANFVMNKDE